MSGNALWQYRWSEEFALGDPLVDAQHRAFFEEAAALRAALASEEPKDEIVAYCSAFITNLRTHFADEERLMARIGFPALPIHQQEHERLLARTESVVAEIHAADCLLDCLLGAHALMEALVEHVTQQDMRIKTFVPRQCA
ncbi:bacteriohemerythrin [Paramagnetospirillum magneticum]|uniref:Hemerythrin-like protein RSc0777 n=1 Tax=Paramagnetospirillum magneticum (strain ATCC 700264 / AMB-1) TaxID=342108 RepID=Q2VZN5_PARM1|nr:hemerythrin domain-containing protein [Paramagnetospirillum magneticum]BAE52940.1 Hemerythrin-like protein RSc0777 [Paramagnetospirillum magneticum AMB-1]